MTETSKTTCPAEISNFCAQRHWAIYWLLIICSVAAVAGRVVNVGDMETGELPFQSANDRSRWCTIRSLGDQGSYEIDAVLQAPDGAAWNTIDKVMHANSDGQWHYFSSKPTLLPSLLSMEYQVVRSLTGWKFETDTIPLVRSMLILSNVIPWGLFLWFLAALVDRLLVRDWSRYFILAAAGFGTYLSTFAVTLNNHLPAAVCVMASLYFLHRIVRDESKPWWIFAATGMSAGFAAANEMPALAFVVAACVICISKQLRGSLLGFLPAVMLVAAAFFGTNYFAHGDWRPPYAHRSDGPVITTVEGDFADTLDAGEIPEQLKRLTPFANATAGSLDVRRAAWPVGHSAPMDRWVVKALYGDRWTIVAQPGSRVFELCQWDNWYDYPGSYWLATNDQKSTIDQGQPSRAVYAFHFMFGHHGIFSLTPIWLLALAGMIALLFTDAMKLRWFASLSIIISVVVIGFYIMRPEMDRNYGGYCSALRWLFWLAPMWLVCMLPVVDWLGRKPWGRWICYILLALSVVSAGVSAGNPWTLPWLYEIWEGTGLPL